MRQVYPVIFTPLNDKKDTVLIEVPDWEILTEGYGMADAVEMARDAIGLMGIDMEDDGKPLPAPSTITALKKENAEDILTLVDVNFAEYRRQHDLHTVKKNCTLPSWLCYEAEKANINFSQILQNALKKELHISDR